MSSLVLFIIIITCLHSPKVAAASVEQIVAPNSVTTVGLPTIHLGNRSGLRIWAGPHQSEKNIVFEEGSGEAYMDNKNDQSKKEIVYFSTNFEGNLNTWSLNVNSRGNSSKSLCYNPVSDKVCIDKLKIK